MKKKLMSLTSLLAAVVLAGCGAVAPAAVPEETPAPISAETTDTTPEAAQAAAEADAADEEKTPADVWQVEPTYSFDAMVPLYSEWTHTAGMGNTEGLYAVRSGERWSLFSAKTGNVMMQDAARQMPYLYDDQYLSVWLDDEWYNDYSALQEKCEGMNAELQANGADMQILYDGIGGMANRWIYTEDGQIYYDLLGTYEFSGTPLAQVSNAPALFGVQQAAWDNEYQCYSVANDALYAVADSAGDLLTDFRYKNVCMAGDELIAVQSTDGSWGYCDKSGNEVIRCAYQGVMQAEGGMLAPIDYPFPDMSGVVVVRGADGAKAALHTDGTACIEAGRFEDLAPAQGGCVWAKQNGLWGLLEVK